jgi:hypothetical protein
MIYIKNRASFITFMQPKDIKNEGSEFYSKPSLYFILA